MKLIFATHNDSKLKEVNQLTKHLDLELVSLKDLNYNTEIIEYGSTLEENAWIKAQTIYDEFKLPVFSEDTGLAVDALNGDPGVRTARYAGENASSSDNIRLLLQNLGNKELRTARFKTDICFISDHTLKHFTGVCEGVISESISGEGGFGYDPIFIPEGYQKTFAELPKEIKNGISHRRRAVDKLIDFLSLIY